ncbi:Ribulokinase [Caulifigura coniformis]|uniref:Ribulokinase n=1 Tax=Caulifigura coniformis TaxID=2527983 RepID=A0A517SIX3_9PLAN|nr:ribulokinase [Caulifigura coniformis]QDT56070.1 Ribulokinase [Caulifigura coniformis]
MSIVAGVDFGTQSVRVSIVDSERGRLGSGLCAYPLHRRREDPDYAAQSHADHLASLEKAARQALQTAGIEGQRVEALAIDTTGSTIVPVDDRLQPLDDYYLWCDHRSWREAAQITEAARRVNLPALEWCGGNYSSEFALSKLLHWLRNNPHRRSQMATAVEHCDLMTAVLCGINEPSQLPRSVCAMGHKWMWNASLGGLPSEEFLSSVDPLFTGLRDRLGGRFDRSNAIAGHLSPEWASRLGMRNGIPLPVGALDAHWDAVGAGIGLGDIVNVIGTSTCVMAITGTTTLIPGVFGVVEGSIHPGYTGIEAGLSAAGDLFDAIARRAGVPLEQLSKSIEGYRTGQTGLLRMAWDNGDRCVLSNPHLGGMTLGWNLQHTAADELFAAIEGTALHTRNILARLAEYGVPIRRVINAGGIPRRSSVLNQVYANILNVPILVPKDDTTSLGSAIFAFLAAGAFKTVEEAQEALCPEYITVEPAPPGVRIGNELYELFLKLYNAFGREQSAAVQVGEVLPALRRLSHEALHQERVD